MIEIVRAASLAPLAERGAQVLSTPLDDPLRPEWIATPTPGIARWLALELARTLGASDNGWGDGIAANITFAGPGGLRRSMLDADPTLPVDGDPWSIDQMLWTLVSIRMSGEVDLGLPGLPRGTAVTAWSRRLARLFAHYDRYRPEMLRGWARNDDRGPGGTSLDPAEQWQPRLFRALRSRLGVPSPAERLAELCPQVQNGRVEVDLPNRLVMFGFATLPDGPAFADLARAMASRHDVHLLLLDPAPRVALGSWVGLTRSWGATAAATRPVLDMLNGQIVTAPTTAERTPADRVLPRLQAILAGESSAAKAPAGPEAGDDSVRIHGAPGARRQVEVLRDALCNRLVDDATLREDDIVVCCTDLERFAPLIESVFGGSNRFDTWNGSDGTPLLRYVNERGTDGPGNPVVEAVAAALELATGRFSALDVVEFCGREAVRRRWEFDDDALATIRRWATDLDVRWGFDSTRRAESGVPESIRAGTWRRALDRLALGAAVARDDVIVGDQVVPVGVEGEGVTVLGRLWDLVGRLAELARTAEIPMPVDDRMGHLERSLRALVAPAEGAEWQLDALARMCRTDSGRGARLGDWTRGVRCDLSDVRPELLARLQTGGGRGGAFRGGITVTTPTGLAGVPFRVVCLLGLDDESLPSPVVDGDDVTTGSPRPTDPSRRDEMFAGCLAAVASARDALLVFHDSRDLATNEALPDGVALAELIAAVQATVGPDVDLSDAAGVRISHPRHATDHRYFRPGDLIADSKNEGRPWSFDQVALAGAKARAGEMTGPPPVEPAHHGGRSSEPESDHAVPDLVALADLASFFKNPARFVCRRVLGVRLPGDDDDLESHLRVEIDKLEEHGLRDDLLEVVRTDATPGLVARRKELLLAADRLPIGMLGTATIDARGSEAEDIWLRAEPLRQGAHVVSMPVRVDLGDGRRIVGELECRPTDVGYQLFEVSASRMKIGDRLRVWVELLALSATHPDATCEAVLVGREGNKPKLPGTFVVRLADIGQYRTAAALSDLVKLYDAAHRSVLVLPLATFAPSLAASGLELSGEDGDDGLLVDAKTDERWDYEVRYSPELAFLLAERSLAEVMDEPARDDDPGPSDEHRRIFRLLGGIDDVWSRTVAAEDSGERGP